jgi:PIN domain nuclease of toxin-antitoxin system
MQIKRQLGKLTLRLPLPEIVRQQETQNGLIVLPVRQEHVFALEGLPAAHKDPFDRLLVAQTLSVSATLVSGDPVFAAYPVPVIW